ncbi:hypothetical protein IMZ11_22890 [Microtetraspora sp. AC03309]|nr:hypothetical protein [Microtetraspora sp. AC03309]MCC5578477.1 hypothetical protein [Microtetraspora sp. AC03309]
MRAFFAWRLSRRASLSSRVVSGYRHAGADYSSARVVGMGDLGLGG